MDVSRNGSQSSQADGVTHVSGPGGFFEVRKMLPLLVQADPEYPSFHVVAFSLPGYGFSEAPKKPGFEIKQFAEVCTVLLINLGSRLRLAHV